MALSYKLCCTLAIVQILMQWWIVAPQPEILLSVLIPSIPARFAKLERLVKLLEKQSDPQMEILVLMDNRRRFLGEKRNALMQLARGKYCCHIDDDELVSEDFFAKLKPELEWDVDLVAYDATCSLNGALPFRVTTILGAANEQPRHLPGGRFSDIVRNAWHWCCWRTGLARQFAFPSHYDAAEDWTWLKTIIPAVKSHRKLNETLFHHFFSAIDSTFNAK